MTPEQAYECCAKHGRNKELEKIISKDPNWAFYYAQYVIKDRWTEAENIILTEPEFAYFYARYIIKGRWIEAENIISTNPEWSFFYSLYVIKGKLPELMHNMMLLHADEYAKEYLEFIKP